MLQLCQGQVYALQDVLNYTASEQVSAMGYNRYGTVGWCGGRSVGAHVALGSF